MNLFFDGVIIIFLIIDALLAVTLAHQFLHSLNSKKSKFRTIGIGIFFLVVFVAGGLVIYGRLIEPRLISVRHESLTFGGSASASDATGGRTSGHLRLALISDLHAPSLAPSAARIFKKIQSEKPDVLLIDGDSVAFGDNAAVTRYEDLGHTGAPLGTFGVLGNHDYLGDATTLRSMLESFGIRILKNENVILEKDGAKFALVGVDDLWYGKPDLDAATAGIPADAFQILVAHNPDIVHALGNHKFDAILSGHTHGGQIRLPWIGPMTSIPTTLGRQFDRGVFDWNDTPLIITEGIGNTGPRVRLFAPPEIMIIDVNF